MSWSINVIGKPALVVDAIRAFPASQRWDRATVAEYELAKEHLVELVGINGTAADNMLVKLEAWGSTSKLTDDAGNVSVTGASFKCNIEPIYNVLL